jgi:uncharacterized OsmC-like protein
MDVKKERKMNIRELQRPIKERYRAEPSAAMISLRATGHQSTGPIACSVEVGRAVHEAQAHKGTGGAGTGACSGDMLLGALAACAQVTCQMVAASMGLEIERMSAEVEGDIDLRGTLGVDRETPVGFQSIRLNFQIEAPTATEEQLADLRDKTTRYCVVLASLKQPPPIEVSWD